jgi:hypothetical protein
MESEKDRRLGPRPLPSTAQRLESSHEHPLRQIVTRTKPISRQPSQVRLRLRKGTGASSAAFRGTTVLTRGITLGRGFGEQAQHQLGHLGWTLWSTLGDGPRLFLAMLLHDLVRGVAGEGRLARQHLVQDGAERVLVRPGRRCLTSALFGARVAYVQKQRAGGSGIRPAARAQHAEISDDGAVLSGLDQDIRGAQATMKDPVLVQPH